MQKKSQVSVDPVVVIIFAKNIYVVKITSPEIIKSELVIFTTQIFFAKNITMTGSGPFQKKLQRRDQQTLEGFFAYLKKITTTGS